MPSSDAQSPEIILQVQKLESDIKSIRSSFDTVSQIIHGILNNPKLPDKYRQEVGNLHSQWQEIRRGFQATLWKARDAAGRAQTLVTDFLMFLDLSLLYPEENGVPKRERFFNYRKSIKMHIRESSEVEQGFKNLTYSIGIFEKDWKESIHTHKLYRYIRAKSSAQLKEIDQMIKRLRLKVVTLSLTLLSALGVVAANTFVSVSQGKLDGTTDALRGFVDQVTKYWNNVQDVRARKDLVKKQRNKFFAQVGEEEIRNIANKIAGFQDVWASIVTDLEFMEKQLENMQQDHNHSIQAFQQRVERARIEYPKLKSVLYGFQTTNL